LYDTGVNTGVTGGPAIHLVLTDDWELRGDGSGEMRAIQFATLRRICDVYERHGLRGSFNVEVLQQLTHLREGPRHPELAELAAEWEAVVTDAFRRGHDVQLHLHPQWTQATYAGGRWKLDGAWSILDYDRDEMSELVGRGKEYLENLLQPIDPSYRCVSYRSGSWCIAPDPDILSVLAEHDLVFDMSIVDGAYYANERVRVDNRGIDEPFLPYHPDMADARRVSAAPQPIVCVPTHSFVDYGIRVPAGAPDDPLLRPSLPHRVAFYLPWVLGGVKVQAIRKRLLRPNEMPVAGAGHGSSYGSEVWANDAADEEAAQAAAMRVQVSDLSTLNAIQMREMLRDIRRRAKASGWHEVPVIIENHTKDIGNWWPIEHFARSVARAGDIEVITLRELGARLTAGAYPARVAREHADEATADAR
jgi:hypothetical protein